MTNSQKTRTVKSLLRDIKKGVYDLNHPVQRKGQQWNRIQKNLLFDSLVNDIVIPPIYVVQMDKLYVLDGKQRLETIKQIVEDECKIVYKEERMKFSQLSEDIQDKVMSSEIHVIQYQDCKDNDLVDLFSRYNNGTQLSKDQRIRAISYGSLSQFVDRILQHPFWEKVRLSSGQIRKGEEQTLVIQSLMLMSEFDWKNLSAKEITRYVIETNHKEDYERFGLMERLDWLDEVICEPNRNLKKSTIPFILASTTCSNEYRDGLLNFLEDYEKMEEFRQYSQSHTSGKESVLGRYQFFQKFQGVEQTA